MFDPAVEADAVFGLQVWIAEELIGWIIVVEFVERRRLEPRAYAAFELGSRLRNEKSGGDAKGCGAAELVIGVVAYARRIEETPADAGLELRESRAIANTCRERIAVLEAIFLALGAEGQDFAFDETKIALIIEFYALAFVKARTTNEFGSV